MPQTLNNENDYRITRSKGTHTTSSSQHQKQDHHLIHPQDQSIPPNDESVTTTRQYLGDVSNQFGASATAKSYKPNLSAAGIKRIPFGGDVAPLQQQQKPLRPTSNTIKSGSNPSSYKSEVPSIKELAEDNNNNNNNINTTDSKENQQIHNTLSSVPRLPQKRQATESSTNLVEKLHTQTNEPQPSSTNQGSYKKARLIDYEWQDLDEEDADDPLMASEYVNDIFTYFYELEQRMLPDSEYLFKQRHLKPKMRSILVDWLVEMHLKFRLLPESLFLAINIMDRFMSLEVVQIDKLQLLATGSLFIAAKYEEVFSPSVKNYAYFTDGSYTEEEILQAEKYILTILSFDLNYPNPMNFLRRISKADEYDVQSRTLGKYLLEVTAIDHKFIGFRPSLCCASAMYLSRLILGKTPIWNGNLIRYSGGYRVNDMKVCIELIFQYLISPVEHDEFFKKYATRKFMKASILCRSWAKKFNSEGKDLFDESLSTHRIDFE
ncbi:G2/mitotic-specific cyclin [Scheffersomyces coipomensis]|uniref:G2/mitotic-specific cyclin n=1 Tax=Scheffersomyces coipomensis TaxID=1788519 RepID=UPI00315D5A85